ncbi:hypothetical protein [Aeromonas veronii]|uniref:hypothetical protein n=1 Tax=Aeromonas veronii TaxID=654 RepID=UPI0018F2751A|nr:hypothetical protein [Aeromonas veronii]MBJ7592896.1 hypothetical protein [Aeromonas veronii]
MNVRIDARLFEILNEQKGVNVTMAQFKKAYALRKSERDSDPVLLARRQAHLESMDKFWSDPVNQELHERLYSAMPELPPLRR